MHRHYTLPRTSFVFLLVTLFLLTACGRQGPILVTGAADSQPAPTVSAAFIPYAPTMEPVPTLRPPADSPPRRPRASDPLVDAEVTLVPVYDDALAPGWSLEHSSAITYDLQSDIYVDKGRYAIRAQRGQSVGTLYFTLNRDAGKTYPRDQVLGLRFRLGGGTADMPNDAFVVAVIGSNAWPYWVEHDTSVKIAGRVTDDQPLFSETRLYYLGINQTIPAKSWEDVIIWIDDLIYDPTYKYVTGFYLKPDEKYRSSFYIDQVSLILMKQ
jgi:hypothetical protein